MTGKTEIDWFLIATVFGGVIAKTVTNVLIERKGVN
jgi:hypothetical protein